MQPPIPILSPFSTTLSPSCLLAWFLHQRYIPSVRVNDSPFTVSTKVYSRSPCTREISHNFVMMPPISEFQGPEDCVLRVGSKYMVYVLLTYTAMEIAVCPISVVRTFFSPQNIPMTYAYALRCAMRSI